MKLWLDAQLPPLFARWINEQGWGLEAMAVRELGLRDATDPEIFQAARQSAAVVMTNSGVPWSGVTRGDQHRRSRC